MADWIPLERGAVCLDCRGIFNFSETKGHCPKCGTTAGWMLTKLEEVKDDGRSQGQDEGDRRD